MKRGVNISKILKTRILKKKIKNFDVFLKLVRIQVLFQVRVFAAKTSKNPQNRDLGCTTTFKWLRRFFHLGTPNAKKQVLMM